MAKKEKKNMQVELVYPIYLDTPMMTAFLASLEGGIVEEASIEEKSSNLDEKNRGVKAGFNTSQLLSGILGIGTEAELARKLSEGLESQYKSTVRFPQAALFIRLRNLLLESGLAYKVEEKDLAQVKIGDIVEIQGVAQANPALQIRQLIKQIAPIVEQFQTSALAQLEQQTAEIKSAKPGQTTGSGKGSNQPGSNSVRKERLQEIENQKQQAKNQVEAVKMFMTVLDGLIPADKARVISFSSQGYSAVARLYQPFIRDEDVENLSSAHWKCMGKVISLVPKGETFDLLQGLPIGYVAKDQIKQIFTPLNSGQMKIEITEPILSGPVLVLAPLAVFS